MSKSTSTINNLTRAPRPAGLLENGDALLARPASSQSAGGGPFKGFGNDREHSSPERIAKAQAYWQQLQARRKDPANCRRCGKPRTGNAKQCQKCLDYQARYRGRVVDDHLTAKQVLAAVNQMRRELDKMHVRFRAWQKAAEYRRNLHYRTNAMRKKYFKQLSAPETADYLAQTNHAYENAGN